MSVLRPGGLELTGHALTLAGMQPGQTLLDIGCGDGTAAAYARDTLGLTVTGVDTDKVAVTKAREKGLNVLTQSADALGFPSRSFDAVLMECVFSILSRQEEAIHEAYCMLKPGGSLIITDLYCRAPDLKRYEQDYKAAMAQFRRPRNHDECGSGDNIPSPYCQDGAVVRPGLTALLEELGLEVTLFEDHTEDLKAFLGQAILDFGSLEEYFKSEGSWKPCLATADPLGYFLLIAKKKADA